MHLFREGDVSEAICQACRKRVRTRFEVRTVRLAESGADVSDVLAAVCSECGGVAAIPAQSAPKLREARERRKADELEARIPPHLDDVVHMLSDHFETAVGTFRPSLLRFYLREVASDPRLARRVKTLADSELAQGRARARVSLRAPDSLLRDVRQRAREAGIASDGELIRGILLAAAEDVLDGGAPDRRLRLSGAAQAEGAPRLAGV
jgi:hypothetical protein